MGKSIADIHKDMTDPSGYLGLKKPRLKRMRCDGYQFNNREWCEKVVDFSYATDPHYRVYFKNGNVVRIRAELDKCDADDESFWDQLAAKPIEYQDRALINLFGVFKNYGGKKNATKV